MWGFSGKDAILGNRVSGEKLGFFPIFFCFFSHSFFKREKILWIEFFLFLFFKNLFIYLFIYFYCLLACLLCWVFVSVQGPSPAAASGGHSSLRRAGLSLSRPLPLRSTGSRRAGSAVVAHGPSRSAACGILPDQGSNPCPLH